jgi:O-antigen/teichoic acid export membrane protein
VPEDLFGERTDTFDRDGQGTTIANTRPMIDWTETAEPAAPTPAPDGLRRERSRADRSRTDLSVLARGGVIVAFGTVFRGVLRFAYGVLLARGLGARGAGVAVEALAVFSILNNLTEFGADTGLSRMIPRYRAMNQIRDLRPTMQIALWPVLIGGALAGVGMFVWAPQLTHIFFHGVNSQAAAQLIRILALFLPMMSAIKVVLSVPRGLGTMVPYVAVSNIVLPGLRFLLTVGAIIVGATAVTLGLALSLPVAIAFVLSMWVSYRLLAKIERRELAGSKPARPVREVASEFWRFSLPRALAGFFQIIVYGLDVLLVGALMNTTQAAIYKGASSYAALGTFALGIIGLALGPQLAHLMAKNEKRRTENLFHVGTWWLMVLAWPVGITTAIFAPLLMRIYGPEFVAGTTALVILSLAFLVQTGTGNNKIVLLMGGKSSLNLVFSAVALVINVGLNLLLIPRYGINGAAIAWAATILFDNGSTTLAVRYILGLRAFGSGWLLVVAAAGICFAAVELAFRITMGPTVTAFVAAGVLGSLLYLVALWFLRKPLQFAAFKPLLRSRRLDSGLTFDSYE